MLSIFSGCGKPGAPRRDHTNSSQAPICAGIPCGGPVSCKPLCRALEERKFWAQLIQARLPDQNPAPHRHSHVPACPCCWMSALLSLPSILSLLSASPPDCRAEWQCHRPQQSSLSPLCSPLSVLFLLLLHFLSLALLSLLHPPSFSICRVGLEAAREAGFLEAPL